MAKQKAENPYYVDKKQFRSDLESFYKTDTDEVPRVLAENIVKIAEGLGYAGNFINYSYKDEMIGDAVVKMYIALKDKKFDINAVDKNGYKYNPFSYFTTIAYHAFINRIKKEKRQNRTIDQYREHVFEELATTELGMSLSHKGDSEENFDYSMD